MPSTLMSRKQGARVTALAALALLLTSPAMAGLHQICYRDLTVLNEPLAVTAHCRSDSPTVSCTINPPVGFTLLTSSSSSGSRSETYRASSSTATYHLGFQFSNGTARGCTVEMGAPHQSNGMPPQGTLAGYTTDASGLVMTGVWRRASDVQPVGKRDFMEVPTDFVVTGGGAVGAEAPNGAMLADLQQAGSDVWEAGTMELLSSDPYSQEAHGIALKIEGLTHADLKAVTTSIDLHSAIAAHPSVTNPVPSGWLAVGGGAWAGGPGPAWHQFLTVDAPVLRTVVPCAWWAVGCQPVYAIDGWTASSKDHIVSAPEEVTAEIDLIRPELIIGGARYVVDVAVRTATSGVAPHPTVAVGGAMGEYALTGVGAAVDWQSYGWAGNLLWKLIPRPDIAGAEAASKDHSYASPATVTAYAIGVRLRAVPFD